MKFDRQETSGQQVLHNSGHNFGEDERSTSLLKKSYCCGSNSPGMGCVGGQLDRGGQNRDAVHKVRIYGC
eukprot:SAG31_NODE_27049_length_432_cov_0.768769_2_plen_69_part_01